ncbi:hypothetical protein FHG87_022546, partial [Trinorchestia longiramus]
MSSNPLDEHKISSKPVGHLVINYSEGRLREAVLSQANNMKLQLLVIVCLIALS